MKKLEEVYANCLNSDKQINRSIDQWISTYSLMTEAITTSEDFNNQNIEEYYIFCLLPFLKLIIKLQQLSEQKAELYMNYADSMIIEDMDYPDDSTMDDAIFNIKRVTRNVFIKEWHRHELQEALDTISNHAFYRRNLTNSNRNASLNKPELIWTNRHVFKKN